MLDDIVTHHRSPEWSMLSSKEKERLNITFDEDGEFWWVNKILRTTHVRTRVHGFFTVLIRNVYNSRGNQIAICSIGYCYVKDVYYAGDRMVWSCSKYDKPLPENLQLVYNKSRISYSARAKTTPSKTKSKSAKGYKIWSFEKVSTS